MPKQRIHNARTGEITEIEISENEMWRKRLELPADATEADIQAERQRLQAQGEVEAQRREKRVEQTTEKLLERIEVLEAAINKRSSK